MEHSNMNSQRHPLTMANEDYLETIYVLGEKQDTSEVRSVDIAEYLGVSKASVSKALNTLREEGYVEQSRYAKVVLTEKGIEYASNLWLCHTTLRSFLIEELNIEPETAEVEACTIEHALSKGTMKAWIAYMDSKHKEA